MRAWSVLVLPWVLAAGCAPEFTSVRETAALGQRLDLLSPVLAQVPRSCALQEAGTALVPRPGAGQAQGCQALQVEPNVAIMLRAVTLLAAYAAALDHMAQDREPSLSAFTDVLGSAYATAAGHHPLPSVTSAGNQLNALMLMMTGGWRRRELRQAIGTGGPAVQAMVERLRQHTRLSLLVLDSLNGGAPDGSGAPGPRGLIATLQLQMADTQGALRCAPADQPCQVLRHFVPAWSLSLVGLRGWLDDQRLALLRLDGALADFWTAFSVLYEHARDPDDAFDQDAAMLMQIRARLRQAHPPPPNPEDRAHG